MAIVLDNMKKLFILATFLTGPLFSVSAQAPVNDDCSTAIDLGIAPACDTSILYSNENATLSIIGDENNPTCFNGGIPNRDVWFSFVCPDTLFDFRVTLTGVGSNSIVNPQFAVYRGDCTFNDLAELDCGIAEVGATGLFLDLQGLTPGITYYIRVSDYSLTAAPNAGDFHLCVGPIPPVVTIDQGGSTLCSGVITDSGGANGDYGPDEDYVFTICPNQPTSCINFTLDYFNIEAGTFGNFTDVLTIYNGNTTFSPVIAQINSFSIAGGGGVCFQVQGTAPCMTLQFISDSNTELDGFLGHWECSDQPCAPVPALSVMNPISNQEILNAVESPATQVSITNIVCDESAYGSFSYPTVENDLQMEKGIILSSGRAADAPGLGNQFSSTNLFTPGDNDLDILSAQQGGQESYDACVVEMDVFVATDQLSFEYVFGSEEYPEFVFSPGGFNDIFAFLVSGPGVIGDPGLGAQKNIAVLPGTSTPVEINSVNNQLNWEYYRNNQIGNQIKYDGLTSDFLGVKKSLTAKTNVIPCNTYHLKLAVADRGDGSFDSGVFVSEIKGGTPGLAVQFASGIEYFIEDCSGVDDQLVITLPEPLTQATTFLTGISGTATLGVDYILNLPPTITFQPGQTALSFPIYPIADAILEGTETIIISLSSNFGCGTVLLKTITVNLEDNVLISVNSGLDTLLVCAGTTYELDATGAVDYFWTPVSQVSNPLIGNPTISPTQDFWLSVVGTVGTCSDEDSVFVKVISPEVFVQALSDTLICQGGSAPLLANTNTGGQGLLWSPTVGLDNPLLAQVIATPAVSTTYTASVTISGCTVTDAVTILVDTLFLPVFTTLDTTICQNYSLVLGTSVSESTTYLWTPSLGLSSDTISNPIATPSQSTTYTLVSTSANGYCSETSSVEVNVISADVEIAGPDYYEICLGSTIPLQATAVPSAGIPVVWSPSFYVTNPTGPTTTVQADESLTITATYNINGCVVYDSIRVRVDSLPDQTLSLRPAKEVYCVGDTVTLLSPTYEPANFPDISIRWLEDGLGQVTPDSFWNLVIRAQLTDTFYRVVSNRACLDTSFISVPIDSFPVVTATASKELVCPGELVQLTSTVSPAQMVEWTPTSGLSCVDCLTPVATISGPVTFVVNTPEANCPATAQVTINVSSPPAVELPSNMTVCPGDTVLLNNLPEEPSTTYLWVSDPPGFNNSSAQPEVSPVQTTTYSLTAANSVCSLTATTTISVAQATVTASADQSICNGSTAALSADAGGILGAYEWLANDVQVVGVTQSVNVSPSSSTLYKVVFTYSPANCQISDEVLVEVNPSPVIEGLSVLPEDGDVCEGAPVRLSTMVNGGLPPYNYTWQQDGIVINTGMVDSIQLSLNGSDEGITYQFSVLVEDVNGCLAGPAVGQMKVLQCFDIPNAFTPDGDGTNDSFGVVQYEEANITVVDFVIYNRWGQKVFTATGSKPRWDGTVDGLQAPVDVYLYQIMIRRADGTEESYSGEVTLLR